MLVKQARVTGKGQVTIPAEMRDALRLRKGDTVTFEVDDQDQAMLRAVRVESPFARYVGALREDRGLNVKRIVEELRETRGW